MLYQAELPRRFSAANSLLVSSVACCVGRKILSDLNCTRKSSFSSSEFFDGRQSDGPLSSARGGQHSGCSTDFKRGKSNRQTDDLSPVLYAVLDVIEGCAMSIVVPPSPLLCSIAGELVEDYHTPEGMLSSPFVSMTSQGHASNFESIVHMDSCR